uniref:C1q-related factor-like n=1 Tax=Crassostrea virginica TaxID=6565 RepID=A0A8B8AIG2_CRAVI|nr:C1q-related factor-like [Crassostrea virginica]
MYTYMCIVKQSNSVYGLRFIDACINKCINCILLFAVKDTPIAFTAGMTSASSSWEGDILVFPHVITNKGHGYSSSSGKFTAPRDGTYVFTVTGVSSYSKFLCLDIVHDGLRKVRTYSSDSARYQTGTKLVVLELDRGDAVWVKRFMGQGYHTNSVPMTTFSGFIL